MAHESSDCTTELNIGHSAPSALYLVYLFQHQRTKKKKKTEEALGAHGNPRETSSYRVRCDTMFSTDTSNGLHVYSEAFRLVLAANKVVTEGSGNFSVCHQVRFCGKSAGSLYGKGWKKKKEVSFL